jgi:hypothetical protein
MEFLRRSALGVRPDEPGPIQELVVLEHSPRAELDAIASAVDVNFHRLPPREIARAVSRAIFIGATAVLFVAWLASSH